MDSILMNTLISGKAEFILILNHQQFDDASWSRNHPVQRKVRPRFRFSFSSSSSPRSPRPQFSLVSRQQLRLVEVQPSHFAAPSAGLPADLPAELSAPQRLPPYLREPSCLLLTCFP